MKDAESADERSPGVATGIGRPAHRSWPRRIGLAFLAIGWIVWFVIGGVFELAASLAIGDHSSYSTAILLGSIVWIGGLVVIGVIISFVSRSAR